jgi:hypothetical protein
MHVGERIAGRRLAPIASVTLAALERVVGET